MPPPSTSAAPRSRFARTHFDLASATSLSAPASMIASPVEKSPPPPAEGGGAASPVPRPVPRKIRQQLRDMKDLAIPSAIGTDGVPRKLRHDSGRIESPTPSGTGGAAPRELREHDSARRVSDPLPAKPRELRQHDSMREGLTLAGLSPPRPPPALPLPAAPEAAVAAPAAAASPPSHSPRSPRSPAAPRTPEPRLPPPRARPWPHQQLPEAGPASGGGAARGARPRPLLRSPSQLVAAVSVTRFVNPLMLTLALATAFMGVVSCDAGRVLLASADNALRWQLATLGAVDGAAPGWRRGVQKAARGVLTAAIGVPIAIATGGDPLAHLDVYVRAAGHAPFPFGDGLAVPDYDLVSEIVMGAEQPRRPTVLAHPLLVGDPMPRACMRRDTLIFLPSGHEHTAIRTLVHAAVPGFSWPAAEPPPLELPREGMLPSARPSARAGPGADAGAAPTAEPPSAGAEPPPTNASAVREAVLYNLFRRMTGARPDARTAAAMAAYYEHLPLCMLGLRGAETVEARATVAAGVLRSPSGARLAELCEVHGCDVPALAQQLADGLLFAGGYGTTHLALHTLERIRSDPARYVPQWASAPREFLLESARLDPPVLSVTALAPAAGLRVRSGARGGGAPIELAPGVPITLLLSHANRDGGAFHRPAAFEPRRRELAKVLSWNGLEGAVRAGTAPRGCPGYELSLEIARQIINASLPEPDSAGVAPLEGGGAWQLRAEAAREGRGASSRAQRGAAAPRFQDSRQFARTYIAWGLGCLVSGTLLPVVVRRLDGPATTSVMMFSNTQQGNVLGWLALTQQLKVADLYLPGESGLVRLKNWIGLLHYTANVVSAYTWIRLWVTLKYQGRRAEGLAESAAALRACALIALLPPALYAALGDEYPRRCLSVIALSAYIPAGVLAVVGSVVFWRDHGRRHIVLAAGLLSWVGIVQMALEALDFPDVLALVVHAIHALAGGTPAPGAELDFDEALEGLAARAPLRAAAVSALSSAFPLVLLALLWCSALVMDGQLTEDVAYPTPRQMRRVAAVKSALPFVCVALVLCVHRALVPALASDITGCARDARLLGEHAARCEAVLHDGGAAALDGLRSALDAATPSPANATALGADDERGAAGAEAAAAAASGAQRDAPPAQQQQPRSGAEASAEAAAEAADVAAAEAVDVAEAAAQAQALAAELRAAAMSTAAPAIAELLQAELPSQPPAVNGSAPPDDARACAHDPTAALDSHTRLFYVLIRMLDDGAAPDASMVGVPRDRAAHPGGGGGGGAAAAAAAGGSAAATPAAAAAAAARGAPPTPMLSREVFRAEGGRSLRVPTFDEDESLDTTSSLANELFDRYAMSATFHPLVDSEVPWAPPSPAAAAPVVGSAAVVGGAAAGAPSEAAATSAAISSAAAIMDRLHDRLRALPTPLYNYSHALHAELRRPRRVGARRRPCNGAAAAACRPAAGGGAVGAPPAGAPPPPAEPPRFQPLLADEALAHMAFGGLGAHLARRARTPAEAAASAAALLASGARACVPGRIPETSAFELDLSWMGALTVRPPFERYGAVAFFDARQRVLAIWWCHGAALVYPGDRRWAHAKWALRSSLLSGVTLRDHLAATHLVIANALATASRAQLGSAHPVRRLLKPFTYRTIAVNRASRNLLTQELSLLHRTVALDERGLHAAFNASFETTRAGFAPLSDGVLFSAEPPLDAGEARTPFAHDLRRYRAVVRRLVDGYVREYYADDAAVLADVPLGAFWATLRAFFASIPPLPPAEPPAAPAPPSHGGARRWWRSRGAAHEPDDGAREMVCRALTSFIVHVTAVHKQVGAAGEYVADPRVAGGKIRPGSELADVQAAVQVLSIALVTSFKQPMLLDDFTHLLLRDAHFGRTRRLFDEFQRELVALADAVERRNARRRFKLNAFNPRRLACSVSI